jgi:hypothetical protein
LKDAKFQKSKLKEWAATLRIAYSQILRTINVQFLNIDAACRLR